MSQFSLELLKLRKLIENELHRCIETRTYSLYVSLYFANFVYSVLFKINLCQGFFSEIVQARASNLGYLR